MQSYETKKVDIDYVDENGNTHLHLICMSDIPDIKLFNFFLDQGIDANKENVNGETCLTLLRQKHENNKELISTILGAIIKKQQQQKKELEEKTWQCIHFDQKNFENFLIIKFADREKNITQALNDPSATINFNPVNYSLLTAILGTLSCKCQHACDCLSTEPFHLAFENGADPNLLYPTKFCTSLEFLIQTTISNVNKHNSSQLLEIIKLFINNGYQIDTKNDLNLINYFFVTLFRIDMPLKYHDRLLFIINTLSYLLKENIIPINYVNLNQHTYLHSLCAAPVVNYDFFKFLITQGVDAKKTNSQGLTCLNILNELHGENELLINKINKLLKNTREKQENINNLYSLLLGQPRKLSFFAFDGLQKTEQSPLPIVKWESKSVNDLYHFMQEKEKQRERTIKNF